jgi:hypothetical protein
MTIAPVLFSSDSEEWATPRAREVDGLKQDWGTHRVFCNPPYGRQMGAWAMKCFESAQRGSRSHD